MVDRHLLREFHIDEAELDAVIAASFPDFAEEDIYHQEAQAYDLNQILTGTTSAIRVKASSSETNGTRPSLLRKLARRLKLNWKSSKTQSA